MATTNDGNQVAAPPAPARAWTELLHLISICARRLRASLAEQIADLGIGELHFSLLWYCHRSPSKGIGQRELAQAIEVSAAHVSGLLEQLRQRDLLTSDRSRIDRRRQVWRVTASGQELIQQVVGDLYDWAATLDGQLGSEQRELLAQLLGDLSFALQGTGAPQPPKCHSVAACGEEVTR